MRNNTSLVILISLFIDVIRADRYAALEDALPHDYDTPNSTSSRSLYRILGYIMSWLFAIFVLRILVLLAGKLVTCLRHLFSKLNDYLYPDNITNSSGRRGSFPKSLGSLGSLSELLHLDDDSDRSTAAGDSYSTWSLDEDSVSVLTKQSHTPSVFSSIHFYDNQRFKKTDNQSSVPDEEEGSYLKAGASTASSIRSRFSRNADNFSHSGITTKRSNHKTARRSRGIKPATEDIVEAKRSKSDERHNFESNESKSMVQKERHTPNKYGKALDQTVEAQGKSLGKYLHKTLGHDAATTASCKTISSNGGTSMVEVDLVSN